jgi:hypothetical protein
MAAIKKEHARLLTQPTLSEKRRLVTLLKSQFGLFTAEAESLASEFVGKEEKAMKGEPKKEEPKVEKPKKKIYKRTGEKVERKTEELTGYHYTEYQGTLDPTKTESGELTMIIGDPMAEYQDRFGGRKVKIKVKEGAKEAPEWAEGLNPSDAIPGVYGIENVDKFLKSLSEDAILALFPESDGKAPLGRIVQITVWDNFGKLDVPDISWAWMDDKGVKQYNGSSAIAAEWIRDNSPADYKKLQTVLNRKTRPIGLDYDYSINMGVVPEIIFYTKKGFEVIEDSKVEEAKAKKEQLEEWQKLPQKVEKKVEKKTEKQPEPKKITKAKLKEAGYKILAAEPFKGPEKDINVIVWKSSEGPVNDEVISSGITAKEADVTAMAQASRVVDEIKAQIKRDQATKVSNINKLRDLLGFTIPEESAKFSERGMKRVPNSTLLVKNNKNLRVVTIDQLIKEIDLDIPSKRLSQIKSFLTKAGIPQLKIYFSDVVGNVDTYSNKHRNFY